jgi:hypothetical protein
MNKDAIGNGYWIGNFGDARLKKTELNCWKKSLPSKQCLCAKWEEIGPVKLNLGDLSGTPK